MAEFIPVGNLNITNSANAASYGYYTRLQIGEYPRRADAFKLGDFKPTQTIFLPLPTELRDDTSVGYTSVNLETVGDVFKNNSEDAMNAAALRAAGQVINSGLSTAKGMLGKNNIASALGGGFIGMIQGLMPAEQINSAIQQQLGAAPNPNPSVQFQGPVLRDFTMSWAFYPKNADESRKLHDTIKTLKARALPSRNKNNGSNSSILDYPHICRINFFPWDGGIVINEEHGWTENSIIRMKKCFMSGVNVNYHPFGTPAFFEGTQLPVSYQLTINFKEIEYLLSEDWDTTAVGERTNAKVNGLSAIATAGGQVIDAGVSFTTQFFEAIPGLLGIETSPPATPSTPAEQRIADVDAIKGLRGGLGSFVAAQDGTVTQTTADGTKYETFATGAGSNFKYFVRMTDKDGKVILPDNPTNDEKTNNAKTFKTEQEVAEYLDSKKAWGEIKPAEGQ